MPALIKTTGNLFLRGFSTLQVKEVIEWQWNIDDGGCLIKRKSHEMGVEAEWTAKALGKWHGVIT